MMSTNSIMLFNITKKSFFLWFIRQDISTRNNEPQSKEKMTFDVAKSEFTQQQKSEHKFNKNKY